MATAVQAIPRESSTRTSGLGSRRTARHMAARFEDATVLGAAAAFEQLQPWAPAKSPREWAIE